MKCSKKYILIIILAIASNSFANITINRYSTISTKPQAEQVNPLLAIAKFKFPVQVYTVGDAVDMVLHQTGYSLIDEQKQSKYIRLTLRKPLPVTVRSLGPVQVFDALEVLMGKNVFQLVEDPLNRKVNFKIRLGMINPNHVLENLNSLIEIFKDYKMFKFLHIPLQAGSNKVLKNMNSFYTIEDFMKIVSKFRKEIPEITIATDIIVGYPTETEDDFKESVALIKSIKPEVLNISRYWAMPGTKAASLSQLNVKEIMKRSKIVSELYKEISIELNKKLVDKEFEVLVDEGKKGNWIARNNSYKQIIINSDAQLFGKQLNVKVTGSGECDLKAVAKDL